MTGGVISNQRRPRGPNASPTRNLTDEDGSARFDSVETLASYFESQLRINTATSSKPVKPRPGFLSGDVETEITRAEHPIR
ncbi:hypothetical protein EYF80_045184 [Liparis tanakae]|uniref:Uncharacterized protein n=1 Tax=Liparis tanakae TaxID=230148 RepID=A0A4Z2FVC0_9TELE|nr:hypothetical protein EYF80_045184 [Liparis tanakae]